MQSRSKRRESMLLLAVTSLRARLLLLVLLAVLPTLGLMLHTYADDRLEAAANVQQDTLRLSRLVAGNHAQLIESTHQLLIALAQLPTVRSGTSADCSALLSEVLKGFPAYTNLGTVKPNGDVACSGQPLTAPVNVADRTYFQRALSTRDFVLGDYLIGRVTGKAALSVAYPILDAGTLQGVLFAAIDLAWFSQLAAQAQLPPQSTLTVMDSQGTILARYPVAQPWLGQALPNDPLVSTVLARGTGTAELPGLDGVARLVAFSPLVGAKDAPSAYISIGIPSGAAYADVDQQMTQNLVAFGGVALLALVAAWVGGDLFIVRRVRLLVNATQRLAAGDLRARTGVKNDRGELSTLAHNFDRMAEALELRDQEQRQSQEALRAGEEKLRLLFTHMQEGLALSELVYDEQANVVDYVIKDVNPRYETILGLTRQQVVGKRATTVYGTPAISFLEIYADVAATGRPATFETYVRRQDKHIRLSAFSPAAGQVATIFSDITEQTRAEERIKRQVARLGALRSIDIAITSSLDLRRMLDLVLAQVTAQLEVDAADILLLEPQTQMLRFAAGRGFQTVALKDTRLRLGEGYAGRAAYEQTLISISDLSAAPGELVRSPILPHESFIAYYAAPLIAKGQVMGVLELFHRAPLEPSEEWHTFLETLAGQAAIAVDSAVLFGDLQRANAELALAYDNTLEGWSHALDMRDRETEGHTQRVTGMVVDLAQAMGLSAEALIHLRRGALLHDIGKMGIPDAILLKPGPLDEAEWRIMRRHPELAYALLLPIAYLRPALDIPYCHHEKWDGSGYPRELKGTEIPLAARIFAVVDVWDALRSDRPYRKGWPEAQVWTYLREQAGRHFDPQVVETFLDIVLPSGEKTTESTRRS